MKVLELCCGSKSFTKTCEVLGFTCTTVDMNPRHEPDILSDVRLLAEQNKFSEGEFDVIWASPPCEHYSKAKTRGKRDLPYYDSIVQACLTIISQVKPVVWIVENPQGMLRHRPFMAELNKWTVDYCMFGAPYRKRTDLFMSDNMFPGLKDMLCDKSCGQVDEKTGKHKCLAQNGPSTRNPGSGYTGKLDARHSVPVSLCLGVALKAHSVVSELSNHLSNDVDTNATDPTGLHGADQGLPSGDNAVGGSGTVGEGSGGPTHGICGCS